MGQRKRNRACAFCGKPATTRDHVPPKGVFPKPRPTDLITVPACAVCNAGSKLDDEYFQWVVTVGTEGNDAAMEIIKKRIGPKFQRRPALLKEIMEGATFVDVVSEGGIFLGEKPAFHYDGPRVKAVIEKIVQGLYYFHFGVRLSSLGIVDDYILNPIFNETAKEAICSLPLNEIGGGIFSYRYYRNEEDYTKSFWLLMFFRRMLFLTRTHQGNFPGNPFLGRAGAR